jgi:hypothetical protein
MQKLITQTIYFSLLALASLSCFAEEQIGFAFLRQEDHGKLVKTQVILKDLYNRQTIEGPYFKIVHGIKNQAVTFSEGELTLRATHAYYHASLARDFFLKTFGAQLLESLPQVTIRLNITNPFDDAAHFVKKEGLEEFNNALSIPASGERRHPQVNAWGPEIWFRPSKEIKLDNSVYLTADALTDPQIRSLFYESIATSTAAQMTRDLSSVFWDFSRFNYQTHLTTMAISLGVLEILPRVVKFSTKKIKRKVSMDALFFPEVIYHEFAHIGFSSLLPLTEYNPVVEGYANYFASQMTDYHKLMYKGGSFVKGFKGKNAKEFQQYSYNLEAKAMAQSSFTFKLLYELQTKLGKELFNQLLIKAAKHPLVYDSIKFGLITALFESVDSLEVEQKEMIKFKIHQVMRDLAL